MQVPLMHPNAPGRGEAAIGEEVAERTGRGRGGTGARTILERRLRCHHRRDRRDGNGERARRPDRTHMVLI